MRTNAAGRLELAGAIKTAASDGVLRVEPALSVCSRRRRPPTILVWAVIGFGGWIYAAGPNPAASKVLPTAMKFAILENGGVARAHKSVNWNIGRCARGKFSALKSIFRMPHSQSIRRGRDGGTSAQGMSKVAAGSRAAASWGTRVRDCHKSPASEADASARRSLSNSCEIGKCVRL